MIFLAPPIHGGEWNYILLGFFCNFIGTISVTESSFLFVCSVLTKFQMHHFVYYVPVYFPCVIIISHIFFSFKLKCYTNILQI